MNVIVAGTFRIPSEQFGELVSHMEAVIAETRQEDGCLAYSYARDVEDPGLIRVFEHWRDQAALDAHVKTPHMDAWREARVAHGFHDRQLWTFDVSASRQF
jgi:quinol monooxygenase YgiN